MNMIMDYKALGDVITLRINTTSNLLTDVDQKRQR